MKLISLINVACWSTVLFCTSAVAANTTSSASAAVTKVASNPSAA